MIAVDDDHHFAMAEGGYYIGKPLKGTGTFGELALAEAILTPDGCEIETFAYVRTLTTGEITKIYTEYPIMTWFETAHPRKNPGDNSWQLLRYRFDPTASGATRHQVVASADIEDAIRRVAV